MIISIVPCDNNYIIYSIYKLNKSCKLIKIYIKPVYTLEYNSISLPVLYLRCSTLIFLHGGPFYDFSYTIYGLYNMNIYREHFIFFPFVLRQQQIVVI